VSSGTRGSAFICPKKVKAVTKEKIINKKEINNCEIKGN
jgi:hypothetical protein